MHKSVVTAKKADKSYLNASQATEFVRIEKKSYTAIVPVRVGIGLSGVLL